MIPLGCKPRFASAGAAVFWWNRGNPDLSVLELLFTGGTEGSQGMLQGLWGPSPWAAPLGLGPFSHCPGCAGQVDTDGWNPSKASPVSTRAVLPLETCLGWRASGRLGNPISCTSNSFLPLLPPVQLCKQQNARSAFDPKGPEQTVLWDCTLLSLSVLGEGIVREMRAKY